MIELLEEKIEKSMERLKGQLGTIRTGRAKPDLLSRIQVDYYGSSVPLQQLVNISVPENTVLMLTVFDQSATQHVERAIMSSDLNLNPQVDGNIIRLRLPELTEERRKDLVKVVRKELEEGRVGLRNCRRDVLDRVKAQEKEKEISEDESRSISDDVQKIVDRYMGKIEDLGKEKESEIMTL